MKKKKSGGGGANWMDTYGDMVTLLLCFFVLLYSMSTISEEKWRAIVTSFNPNAILTPTENSGNDGPNADNVENPGKDSLVYQQEAINNLVDELYEMIQQMVGQEGLESSVQVSEKGGKIYITFSDQVFFAPDQSYLLDDGKEVLLKLAGILDQSKDAIEEIRVQGHTAQGSPDRRNDPAFDRELSSFRALRVVLFLQENSSIHPARLVGEGWGQWHPIASNQQEETKRFNRRVEMIITGRDLDLEAAGEAIQTYVSQDNADMGLDEQ